MWLTYSASSGYVATVTHNLGNERLDLQKYVVCRCGDGGHNQSLLCAPRLIKAELVEGEMLIVPWISLK